MSVTFQTYQQNIEQFEQYSKLYQQDLGDTTEIDCKSKPELFKAGLELSRLKRAQLLKNTQTIQAFIANDLQTELGKVKAGLNV